MDCCKCVTIGVTHNGWGLNRWTDLLSPLAVRVLAHIGMKGRLGFTLPSKGVISEVVARRKLPLPDIYVHVTELFWQ